MMRESMLNIPEETRKPRGTSSPPNTSVRDQEIDEIIADLLTDLPDGQRPAVRALATRVATAMRRGLELDRVLDQASSAVGGDWIAMVERIGRLRAAEDLVVRQGLLALELLRERQVEVRARRVRPRRAGGARR